MKEINAGIYAFDLAPLFDALRSIASQNAQGEFYLTDLVGIYRRRGLGVETLVGADRRRDPRRQQPDGAWGGGKARASEEERRVDGVGRHPRRCATTYIDVDVTIGPDTVIHPNVVIEGATTIGAACEIRPQRLHLRTPRIGDRVTIKSFCVHRRRSIADGAVVGPFAHIRPESAVGDGRQGRQLRRAEEDRARRRGRRPTTCRISATPTIGADVNIGAGTITCNYDGAHKHQTVIEDGAFIGSDSQLIAPVTRRRRAPTSAPARRSPRTCPRERWGSPARASRTSTAGPSAKRPRHRKKDGDRGSHACAESSDTSAPNPSCRSCSTGCGAWSTAATTRPAWRWSSPEGISLRRSAGKLVNLENAIRDEPVDGLYGVGHTRWATHGRPTEENAHPHRDCTGSIVVVHNGIIENYLELKHELQAQGHRVQDRDRHRDRRAPGRTRDAATTGWSRRSAAR